VSEELLRFCIDHRLRVVLLLGHAQGSTHAAFRQHMDQRLVALAIEHAHSVGRHHRLAPPERLALELIYRGFVATMIELLDRLRDLDAGTLGRLLDHVGWKTPAKS